MDSAGEVMPLLLNRPKLGVTKTGKRRKHKKTHGTAPYKAVLGQKVPIKG